MFENYIIKKLKKIKNKNDIYYFLNKKGKKISKKYPNKYIKNKFLINNCQTNVWLYLKYKNNKLSLKGKSDSNIINGILYIIINIYNNKTPLKIIKYKIKIFKKLNFIEILSFNRYNGIFLIIKKIKNHALLNFKKQ
ncbi:MAG: SufE family protein [Candidatus Shikimatogenerans bostrichidophilus]|nr:MAG: SufE family protein [Candidatus Shikimatogenerans bostrichidophilus]